ncbi:MAG TPA: tetratricopeptide repeat protein [Gammaproteobacteria bacterium]|nr:tetratricopeptide repeat protein [Gammaproteobacteria bacterium]
MDDADMDLASGIAAFESKEFRRSLQLLQPLAENGNPEAQYRLAVQYQAGLGVVPNELQAYRWMREAAAQNHDLAMHALGIMYLYGECVEKNEREAAKWLQRAADLGLAGSMAALAGMYEQGVGVEADAEKAKQLYEAAGLAGSPPSD